MTRAHIFNPGPAAMPLPVLKEVQQEFLDYKGTGMSIVEISHRSPEYQEMQAETEQDIKDLLKIPDGYHVLFMQGGGSMQFILHAQNFLIHRGAYINTGSWATKAEAAASFYGETYELASSKDDNFSYIPEIPASGTWVLKPDTDYVHITVNNTIHGTEWWQFPHFDVPLFADMSSDFLSRPVDVSNFDLIYAGIQKNVGPAGCVVVIIKDELLRRARTDIAPYLQYKTFVEKDSTYNTPPVFNIYFLGKVAKWLKNLGGLDAMYEINKEKAGLIYSVIDESDGFYKGHARPGSRSLMNITFNMATPELEADFAAEAAKQNLIGVKGHRSVGGCRVSTYNAVTMDDCKVLAKFMRDYQHAHASRS